MSEETEWKTIRVPKDVYNAAKEAKEAHNVTWGQYVNPNAWHSVFDDPDAPPASDAMVESTSVDASEIAEAIQGEISMANEPGVTVDVEGLNKEIRKLQELVERVPENTAEQLESTYR